MELIRIPRWDWFLEYEISGKVVQEICKYIRAVRCPLKKILSALNNTSLNKFV